MDLHMEIQVLQFLLTIKQPTCYDFMWSLGFYFILFFCLKHMIIRILFYFIFLSETYDHWDWDSKSCVSYLTSGN